EERKEVNPFHVHEFDFSEFSELLKRYFTHVEIAFQNHVASLYIGNPYQQRPLRSQIEKPCNGLEHSSHYFVAICSDSLAGWQGCDPLVYVPASSPRRDRFVR
ncbi:MAG: hypothetical protein L0387_21475, partial [Acidobacteria bacterium]|nr:hypothetical protein [Acidobacteriota bacterium]